MVWDYIETDPFRGEEGVWNSHVRWIEQAVRSCSNASKTPARVLRGDAQGLGFEDGYFDAVIVDPPYYDAIQYGDLSDFFYVWLKRSIGHLYPNIFATPLTPKKQEIIENRADKKSPEYVSHDEFDDRLQRALRSANLIVTTSWPMRSEREARNNAHISAVLDSSVVLACRPQQAEEEGFYDDVVRSLERRITERLTDFEEMGLVG